MLSIEALACTTALTLALVHESNATEESCPQGSFYDGMSGNIALGKPATQSSEGWGGAPSRAVDGDTTGDYGEESCTHTEGGDPEWWQVDLGQLHAVTDFSVYHRTGVSYFSDRLVGAKIMLSSTDDYTTGVECLTITVGGSVQQPGIGSCDGAIGQFITVVHQNDFITICEFEASGSVFILKDIGADYGELKLSTPGQFD
jgi:hypothetical protein